MKKVKALLNMALLSGLALAAVSCNGITSTDSFADANASTRSSRSLSSKAVITSDLNPGYGKAVFFAGTFDGNWSKAYRGTYSDAEGWTLNVNADKDFEYKTLTGSYDLGEVVTRKFNGLSKIDTIAVNGNPSYYKNVGFGNALYFVGNAEPTYAVRGVCSNNEWKLDANTVYGSADLNTSYDVYTGSWNLGSEVKGNFENLTWTEGENIVFQGANPVARRALSLANVDNSAIMELDIISLEKMFASQKINGKAFDHNEKAKNLTLAEIKNKIKTVFADTDDNDVSYLVISCHGSSDGGIYIGTDTRFTGATLRATLDEYVRGEVVVMIDCCYAGQAINKAAVTDEAIEDSLNAFVADFIGTSAKSGELASERFHVLCAANKNQYSYGGTVAVGIGAWEKGLGWNATGDCELPLNADANNDNQVTLAELQAYSAPLTAHMQTQVVYPEDDQLVIGGRF